MTRPSARYQPDTGLGNWTTSSASIVDDLEALAEQIKNSPSIRTCEGVHPIVKHWKGRLWCLTCLMTVVPPAEMVCDCLDRMCLVFERDGMYHAKPGPCVGL